MQTVKKCATAKKPATTKTPAKKTKKVVAGGFYRKTGEYVEPFMATVTVGRGKQGCMDKWGPKGKTPSKGALKSCLSFCK